MKFLITFLIATLYCTQPFAQSAGGSLKEEKTALKSEISQALKEGRAEFKLLQQKAATSKPAVADKSQQALERVENDLRALEIQPSKVDRATEENWEGIKTTAHGTIDRLKESLVGAKAILGD